MASGKLVFTIIAALAAMTAFSTYKFTKATVFAPQVPEIVVPSPNKATTSTSADTEHIRLFKAWKNQFQKHYSTQAEDNHRFTVFVKNLLEIREKSKKATYKLALNKFSDLTDEEFKAKYLGLKPSPSHGQDPTKLHKISGNKNPASVDYRDKLVGVKNQQSCGSCWTFGSTASIEYAYNVLYKLSTKDLLDLSEQQMVDCASKFGNHGCQGGYHDRAFNYVRKYGQELETSYPYMAKDQKCSYDSTKLQVQSGALWDYRYVPKEDGQALEDASAGQVVSVGVDATPLKSYTGGVFDDWTAYNAVNHAVTLVGYGTDSDTKQDYWLVRNSWGPDWAEEGYFRLLKDFSVEGPGILGIRIEAAYPLLKKL